MLGAAAAAVDRLPPVNEPYALNPPIHNQRPNPPAPFHPPNPHRRAPGEHHAALHRWQREQADERHRNQGGGQPDPAMPPRHWRLHQEPRRRNAIDDAHLRGNAAPLPDYPWI